MKKLRPEIQVHFSSKIDSEPKEYKDKFTDDLKTLEDIKNKHGVVVWCKYKDCINNKKIEDLQRTSGTLLKNRSYSPINENEHIWDGICIRDEIAINYTEVVSSGSKFKVPSCFVAATNKTGHIDFSRFLQSDGSPIGGSLDSQHVSDEGYGALDSNNIYEN